MKLTNKQYIIAGLSLIAVGATVAIIITKQKKKKVYAELVQIATGGVGQFGDYNDMPSMNALNPTFWRKPEFLQGTTYDFNKAINIAKSLHGYINEGDDELAYTIISGMISQVQVSEVAEAYKTTYGGSLSNDLIDGLSNKWLNKIYTFINTLPINKPR